MERNGDVLNMQDLRCYSRYARFNIAKCAV